ncbi:MAG: AAA family ATPase, partial [Planctomycetes bacterium]|nr:AAA family ATPase [Planctomycetota bacterium]
MSQAAPRTLPLEDLRDPGLVQRREEIAFLDESLDETRRKGLRFALLVGPEGMGKTALLSSFAEKIAPEEENGKAADPSVFEVDCRLSSVNPFAPILALLARIFKRHGRTTKIALAGEGTGFDMDMIEFTIEQLREDGAEDLFAQIASDDATLFRGIGEFLARHGRARTMVLALENLQDIGGKSAAFLEGFLRSPQAADSHLLWLGLYRGDNQVGENEFQKVLPRLRRGKFFREAALSPLKMPAIEAMLSGMIGSIADWRRVVSQFQEATQGNPLQIREMVENLVKKGKVVARGDRWAIEAASEDLAALPEAMEERLIARLPGLGKPHLDLLSWCAVAKRSVPSALAEQVAGLPPNRIVYLWNDLVKDQYLREVKPERAGATPDKAGPASYAFASARVREKVYANLSEKDRAKRHLAVARGLETLHAKDLGPIAPELVEHFAKGENPKKEKSYAMLSGETLLARGDAAAAVEMFERGLSLLGAKGDRQEKRAARLALGRAFLLLDEAETARGHFEAARGDSNGAEMAECLEGMGETFLHQRRFEKAAQCFEDARKHLSKKDSPVSLDVSLAS